MESGTAVAETGSVMSAILTANFKHSGLIFIPEFRIDSSEDLEFLIKILQQQLVLGRLLIRQYMPSDFFFILRIIGKKGNLMVGFLLYSVSLE